MKKIKVDQRIRNNLFSANDNTVIAAIQELRVKGNKAYLPLLFELLLTNPVAEIEKEIVRLLGTVKDKDTTLVFAEAVNNHKYKSIQKQLLTACWQNGLDYSPHLSIFIDAIIVNEWEVAFEAFTVIDNLEELPGAEVRNLEKTKIENALATATDQKEYLLKELIKILELH